MKIKLILFAFLFFLINLLCFEKDVQQGKRIVSGADYFRFIKKSDYFQFNNLDSSLIYAQDALRAAQDLKSSEYKLQSLIKIGLIQRRKGLYYNALNFFYKALAIAEKENRDKTVSDIKNQIGNVYNFLGNLEQAKSFYFESLKLRLESGDSLSIAASYNNLGNVYKTLKKTDSSFFFLKKSVRIRKAIDKNDPLLEENLNFGALYTEIQKYDSALASLNMVLKIYQENNNIIGIANTLIHLSKVDNRLNRPKEAYKKLSEAITLLNRINSPHYYMEACKELSATYDYLNDTTNSLKYLRMYNSIRDSVYSFQINHSANSISNYYAISKKENTIKDLESNRQKIINVSIIAGSALILIITFFLFKRGKEKIKTAKEISNKNTELETALTQKEKAQKIKSEFLAQMSHEIRTPVNAIISFSSLIKEEVSENVSEDLKDSFMMIEKAGKRIIRTIDSMLNMSELQTGSYEIKIEKQDFYESIVIPVCNNYRNEALHKGIDFTVNNNADNFIINADHYTMLKVVENLVDNAVKFTETGSVGIELYNSKEQLIIEIKDTGIGISSDYLPNLFQLFSQEEQGYTRSYDGNGLGLALVKNYCDINGAEIEVKSEKGKGSTFRVIIKQ